MNLPHTDIPAIIECKCNALGLSSVAYILYILSERMCLESFWWRSRRAEISSGPIAILDSTSTHRIMLAVLSDRVGLLLFTFCCYVTMIETQVWRQFDAGQRFSLSLSLLVTFTLAIPGMLETLRIYFEICVASLRISQLYYCFFLCAIRFSWINISFRQTPETNQSISVDSFECTDVICFIICARDILPILIRVFLDFG